MKTKRIASMGTALALAVSLMGGVVPASAADAVPQLTAKSTILGLVDTGNKTTVKYELIKTSGPGDINLYYYNEAGKRVMYDNQDEQCIRMDPVRYQGSAVLSVPGGDPAKLDINGAKVELQDSNTTHADEVDFDTGKTGLKLTTDGIEFTLEEGALEWRTWDYYDGMAEEDIDLNSGREWSMMGGDGNGVYEFIFQVSGVKYDGKMLDPVTFRGYVYTYGRTSTDLGLGLKFEPNTYDKDYTSGREQTGAVQWGWHTEGKESAADKPYMNDNYSDYFSVTWPTGTDASGITAQDVTVTLRSRFGDEYVLSKENAYGEQEYAVEARENETEIIVTYQQWACIPAYSTMEIAVDNGEGLTASKTYDVSSVNVWAAQTGGGGVTVEHTVVVQNYDGLTGLTLENAANTEYTLSTVIDGVTYFYAEENGVGSLVEGSTSTNAWGMPQTTAPDNAWKGDATEMFHVAAYGSSLFYETPAQAKTEVKTVDGEDIAFAVNFSAQLDTSEMVARGAKLDPGFNLYNNGANKWAWSLRYQAGWNMYTEKPASLPYQNLEHGNVRGFAAGSSNPAYDEELANPSTSGPGGMGGPGGPGSIGGPGGPGGPGGLDDAEGLGGPGSVDGPKDSVPEGTYTVVKGDSLWRIAQKVYGTGTKWTLIFEANRDVIRDSNVIYVGQTLKIPAE